MNSDLPPTEPGFSPRSIRPFVWVALIWGAVSALGVCAFSDPGTDLDQLKWMLSLWVLCLINLTALTKTIQAVISLAAFPDEETTSPEADTRKTAWVIQAFFWGIAKLSCIGALIAVLIAGKDAPRLGLLLGASTLLVVPLVGGFWWSKGELSRGPQSS